MQVVSYGISINLVEVTWKSKIKQQFPNPNDYSSFMGDFSSSTGAVTFLMMLLSRFIFRKFGWGVAALITPTVLLVTGTPILLAASKHFVMIRKAARQVCCVILHSFSGAHGWTLAEEMSPKVLAFFLHNVHVKPSDRDALLLRPASRDSCVMFNDEECCF